MREFNYQKLEKNQWDTETLSLISKINFYAGRQDLFTRQKPKELSRLVEIAKIQSTESSNKIEGIVSTKARIRDLVKDKTTPRNRDEKEILGYRDVLNTIHESYSYIDLTPSIILQLHRDMEKKSGVSYAGHFKNTSNSIVETHDDGSETIRFNPMEPYETPMAVEKICDSYNETIAKEILDPLIVISAFILDFLCIHPFNDGNGRMSRLLTLLLLYKSGYIVGKYISIEHEIEKNKDAYYDALQQSDVDWHRGNNDPTPFIKYMLRIILSCYITFEDRVNLIGEDANSKSTGKDIVNSYIKRHVGKFTSAEVIQDCPSIGRTQILNILKELVTQNIISKHGQGKNTFYTKNIQG